MSPEEQARLKIDEKLIQAGWVIHDMKQLNLGAEIGVAVREHPTDTGPADYFLFVNRSAVGVIEAKKDGAGENITFVEYQTERYATASLKWRKDSTPLRFLFEAKGQIDRFTDNSDPAPRSREIFQFFKPETLAGTPKSSTANRVQLLFLGLLAALDEQWRQQVAVEHSLKQSATQRKNILRAAFSGQLVPQDPNDEPASVLLARIVAERAERDTAKKPRGRKAKETA